jgi:hypothetical protein
MCGNALQGYEATLTDFTVVEICEDCLETLEESGKVLMSKRFAGLRD